MLEAMRGAGDGFGVIYMSVSQEEVAARFPEAVLRQKGFSTEFVELGESATYRIHVRKVRKGHWRSLPQGCKVDRNADRQSAPMEFPARANPTWGEERIADELLLKLWLRVSPHTVGRYLRRMQPPRGRRPSQRWATFVRNHAHAVLACDFFIAVTARFRLLYVFVVLDVGTRRMVHWNVTAHPT